MIEQLDKVEEKAAEVIEEVADLFGDEKLEYSAKDVRYAALTSLILGSTLTGILSYLIGKRRNKVIEIDNVKIFESREDPNQLKLELDAEELPGLKKRWTDELIPNSVIANMREEPKEPEEIEEAVIQHIAVMADHPVPDEITVDAEEVPGWDYTAELQSRKRKDIYIIHRDEFWANEENDTQNTLTYYAGDDILCSEDDSPIYNHENLVGELRFGHGSGDPNVVYVRNVTREAEYEILLDIGKYTIEVLGLDNSDEIAYKKPAKFRPEK